MNVEHLGLIAFLVMAVGAVLASRPFKEERETYYLHDTPTGLAVVALSLSEASVRRQAGTNLRGPYLSYAEAEKQLYNPAHYLGRAK